MAIDLDPTIHKRLQVRIGEGKDIIQGPLTPKKNLFEKGIFQRVSFQWFSSYQRDKRKHNFLELKPVYGNVVVRLDLSLDKHAIIQIPSKGPKGHLLSFFKLLTPLRLLVDIFSTRGQFGILSIIPGLVSCGTRGDGVRIWF